jgi:LysM repeat protein
MALPSQVERNVEMSRPVMSRGGDKGVPRPLLIGGAAVLVAAAGLTAYYFWPAPATAQADNAGTTLTQPSSADKARSAAVPATDGNKSLSAGKTGEANVTPAPVTIRQATTPQRPASTLGEAFAAGQASSTPGSNPGNTPGSAAGTPGATPVTNTPGTGTAVTPPGSGGAPSAAPTPDTATGPTSAPTTAPATSQTRGLIETGDRALAANKLVEARVAYSRALLSSDASVTEQEALRQRLTAINEDLVFSPKVTPDDPLTEMYTVVAGDALERIRRKRELTTEWMLIQRINKLSSPNALKVGQKLKLVRGPFHAVIDKSDFRVDIFTGSPEEPDRWLYIRSFKVGLGADNGTPLGTFTIRNKMQDPQWRNPRTGEFFENDDPKNPIGEYWLGWEGLGDSAPITGYGLHGTVDPASVGQQMSMGCARLLDADIKLIYELLAPRISIVKVVP